MDKMQRYELYKASVYPGWWDILDRFIPKILEADPNTYLYIKEKFSFLRIEMSSTIIDLQQQIDWEKEAEVASSSVCEYCGQPGRIRPNRSWMQTLCDRCNRANSATKRKAIEEVEQRWLKEAK